MRRSLLIYVFPILAALLIATACPAQNTGAPAEPPNYAHGSAMHSLLHWTRFPIHVYFTPGPAATEDTRKAAQAGFTEWVLASRGVISYDIVADPAAADVRVTLLPDLFLPKQRGVTGATSVTYLDDVLTKAAMEIATGGATPDELQTCAAHEFGHALGINGHSSSEDDLMFPVETRIFALDGTPVETSPQSVSARDLNTLKLGYGPVWTRLAAHLPPAVPPKQSGH
jgi:predicted Zn-dependent protease